MKNKTNISFILLFFVFLCYSSVFSQQKINSFHKDAPIEIFADQGIEWDKNKRKYIARGNTKVIRNDLTVTSDQLEAFYNKEQNKQENIELIEASGNVIIKTNTSKILGGKVASYFLDKEYFIVKGGDLKLFSNQDKLMANQKIEFWESENIAVATGKATAIRNKKYFLKGDKLAWYLKKNNQEEYEVVKIIGFSNVKIENENEIAFSDKALYNNKKEICKLYGNVKLKRGENFLTGEYAEINLKTGISKLLPYPSGKISKTEKRVKALIKKNKNE